MSSPKVDRRVRKTKEALRNALITLMKDKTIQEISVQELTDLADIHRGTFYLHYRDIYDLYEQIENEIIEEISSLLNQSIVRGPYLDVVPALEKILKFVEGNSEISEMLLAQSMSGTFVKKLSELIKSKLMHINLQNMDLAANQDEIMYLSDFLAYGYIAVIKNWLENGMPESAPVMAERIGKYGSFGISYYEFDK